MKMDWHYVSNMTVVENIKILGSELILNTMRMYRSNYVVISMDYISGMSDLLDRLVDGMKDMEDDYNSRETIRSYVLQQSVAASNYALQNDRIANIKDYLRGVLDLYSVLAGNIDGKEEKTDEKAGD